MSKTKISAKLRYEILERDGKKCLWCGRGAVDGVTLHIDHVLPESFGGSTSYDNLGTLCDNCNLGKSNDYCGSYLLTTLVKMPNIWEKIEDFDTNSGLGKDGKHYDGKWHDLKLTFYQNEEGVFRKKEILHSYLIPEIYLISVGADTEIKLAERKRNALLDFRNKLRDFLFENKGYLEGLDDKIVFKIRK